MNLHDSLQSAVDGNASGRDSKADSQYMERVVHRSGRVNSTRILTGGLAAGVVIILANVAAQVVLAERVQNDMNAWMPGAAARMQMSGAAVVAGLAMKLAIGVILVWLYAVARPRWGPRMAASLSALAVWALGAIYFADFPLTGMLSWSTYALLEALQLIAFIAAAWVGAWLYGEPRG